MPDRRVKRFALTLAGRSAAIAASDTPAFAEADVAYHLGIARASGNRLLADIYASFDGSLRESVTDASCLAQGSDPDRADMHDSLYRAIADGDPDAAQAAAIGVLEQQEQLLDERP